MTPIEPKLLEQLSAWMDGELPADEARFLQRRLHNDAALRDQWERWQLASACLRAQPLRLQDASLAGRIRAAIAPSASEVPSRAPRLAWLASAAALALAAVLLPGVVSEAPLPAANVAGTAPVPALPEVAGSAALAESGQVRPPMSPLPSVRDFPLADTGAKSWPRSPLLPEASPRDGLVVRSDGPLQPSPPRAARQERGSGAPAE